MAPTPGTALIGLDWGSSALRAFRMDAAGRVLEERASEAGASRITGGAPAFEAALRALVGDWLQAEPRAPVLACGMVGSQHGWREAPYAACPVQLDALGRQAVTVQGSAGLRVHILPGLSCAQPPGLADVMRGEETQLAGLLAAQPALARHCTVVLPGTHSKWVEVRGGSIVRFRTCMTGELYALLRAHSVLGRQMQAGTGLHAAGFEEGVLRARRQLAPGLAWDLFSARARVLLGQLAEPAVADYVSGLLVGQELAEGLRELPPQEPVALVGEASLCERYATALRLLGRAPAAVAGNTAAQGLWLQFAAGLRPAEGSA